MNDEMAAALWQQMALLQLHSRAAIANTAAAAAATATASASTTSALNTTSDADNNSFGDCSNMANDSGSSSANSSGNSLLATASSGFGSTCSVGETQQLQQQQQTTEGAKSNASAHAFGAQANVSASMPGTMGNMINIAAAISLGMPQRQPQQPQQQQPQQQQQQPQPQQQQQPQQQLPTQSQYYESYNAATAAAAFAIFHPDLVALQQQRLLLQRQQQYLLYRQQQLTNAIAQQQLTMANNQTQQPQDEISRSLQQYAMLSAFQSANEPLQQINPVDLAMQDLANNGLTYDDYRRYQWSLAMETNNQQQQQPYSYERLGVGNNASTNNNARYAGNNMGLWLGAARSTTATPMQESTHTVAAAAAATFTLGRQMVSPERYKKKRSKENRNTSSSGNKKHCVFCHNNQEPDAIVYSHTVRDNLGRVLCPRLRTYICPICKVSGDYAHTIKYCPKKPIVTMDDALAMESRYFKRAGRGNHHVGVGSGNAKSSSSCSMQHRQMNKKH